jgi:type II secretion system protein G
LQIFVFVSLSSLCPLWQIRSEEVNLLKNGGFEEGDRDPKFWDRLDGLTMFWEKDELRSGKCLRLYTRIDNNEYEKRQDEMKLDNPPPPKKPREIKGIGYDTVGGNDGVSYYSDFIDVKPGMIYTLSADVRSEGGTPKIFVKGYTEMPQEIDDNGKAKKIMLKRNTYKFSPDFEAGTKAWKTTSLKFCPTHDRDDVKQMRVMIYAYWPPQNYYFDNLKIVESGLDAEAPKRWAVRKASAQANASREGELKIKEAKAGLKYLRSAIDRYKADLNEFPDSLQALLKSPGKDAWAGPYVMDLGEDPWGNAYKYAKKADAYTVKSFGPDGAEGGGDDVE